MFLTAYGFTKNGDSDVPALVPYNQLFWSFLLNNKYNLSEYY